MARVNLAQKADPVFTHEGARAAHINPVQRLRRSVLSCLLWESEFYEDGASIADRIREGVDAVSPSVTAALAVEARTRFHLRHVPLYLTALLAGRARGSSLVSETLAAVVQRADELAEFLAVYAKVNGVAPNAIKPRLSNQVRKGLAAAFVRFDDYALAKYDRAGAVRLRDALFLCHAKPRDAEQRDLWSRLISGSLAVPDTWETELSAGKDRKATWERLLREGKLGYLALLRNLRNMQQAGADERLVRDAILARKGAGRVLPFRYVAAARAAPMFEPELDAAMLASLSQSPKLPGKTVVVIDVSGSMYGSKLSAKSDMTRADAACALGGIVRETCERVAIYATAGNDGTRKHATALVPARHGMALVDAIHGMCRPLGGGGIFLKQVMDFIAAKERDVDRVIVITDEQDCGIGHEDNPLNAKLLGRSNYLINVASARNGVGYGAWTHLDGFSEHVLRWIAEHESDETEAQ